MQGNEKIILEEQDLEKIIQQTVRRTAEEIGAVPRFIERKEAIQMLNGSRYYFEKGIKEGYINPVSKSGSNGKVKVLRSEIEHYASKVILKKASC